MKFPPTTNKEIRQWYLNELATIPELNKSWIEEGLTLKQRAILAWKFRHDKRLQSRGFMPDPLDVELLRQRDKQKYGSPNGPTFLFLVKRLQKHGLSENEVYEAIIKGAYRTDAGVNETLGF